VSVAAPYGAGIATEVAAEMPGRGDASLIAMLIDWHQLRRAVLKIA
jgi:hypothetical protein